MPKPLFYLASSEGYGLEEPRRCTVLRQLRTEHRNDLLLITVDPPIIGMGDRDLTEVIVATRHQGETLDPMPRLPVDVHVARPLVDLADREILLRS